MCRVRNQSWVGTGPPATATPPWPAGGAPGVGAHVVPGRQSWEKRLLAACGVMDALPHQALAGAGGVGLVSPGTRHRQLRVCEDRSPPRRLVLAAAPDARPVGHPGAEPWPQGTPPPTLARARPGTTGGGTGRRRPGARGTPARAVAPGAGCARGGGHGRDAPPASACPSSWGGCRSHPARCPGPDRPDRPEARRAGTPERTGSRRPHRRQARPHLTTAFVSPSR